MDTDIFWIAGTGVILSLPYLASPKRMTYIPIFYIMTGLVIILVQWPDWHDPDMSLSAVSLRSKTFPPMMTLPYTGYPGLPGLSCEISGIHSRNIAPAIPDDLNSETASTTVVDTIETRLVPDYKVYGNIPTYSWNDWVGTIPYHTYNSAA